MHEARRLVINTGPIIAVVAALGDLKVLKSLYDEILVPFDVGEEILAGGPAGFAVPQLSWTSGGTGWAGKSNGK